MNATLKAYAVEQLGVPADADEEQFDEAIRQAVAEEKLALGELQKMQQGEMAPASDDEDMKAAAELIGSAVGKAMEPVNRTLSTINDRLEKLETPPETRAATAADDGPPEEPTEADKAIATAARAAPRMKDPIEAAGYSTTKQMARFPATMERGGKVVPHPMAGHPVMYGAKSGDGTRSHHRPMYEMSDAEAAQVGAWIKWNLCGGGPLRDAAHLSEQEKQLVNHCLDKGEWVCGEPTRLIPCWDGAKRLSQLPGNLKASLLNDTTSGGSYAVPRAFDDQLFMDPILYGELVPWVSILDLPQGSVVDGAYLAGALSITSNTAEGSAITLFDATGLIGNLDTTIYTCSVGIEMGLDWLDDQAMDLGRILPMRMGERLREWLDNQIANGDGTTEPEGIFTKSGTGTTGSVNGTAGAISVNDIEEQVFGLTKARRKRAQANARFVTNDTMYKRMCQVPVGSSDARRVLKPGMDHENYTLMDRGVSIQENIANGSSAFCALDEYQLVRRLGSQFRETQEGSTLIKSNDKIMVLRARFGGQLTLAGACFKITDLDQSVAA